MTPNELSLAHLLARVEAIEARVRAAVARRRAVDPTPDDPFRGLYIGDDDVERLLADPGIIRHRGKIEAAITNARASQCLRAGGTPLTDFLWSFAPPPRPARPRSLDQVPSLTPESAALSKELRRRGFRFVGPTVVYAFMQAVGIVDDHLSGCEIAVGPRGE